MDYRIVGKREVSLMEEDWDYLIVLDACRHDYFKRLYHNYLSGELWLAFSSASDTREWVKKTLSGKYDDVVYISANPHVNSKGVDVSGNGFDAREHFPKIVDVWDFGWDEKAGTIPPEEVNHAAIKAKLAYPDERLIIHYLQPHAPYLCLADHAPTSVLSFHELGVVIHFLRNRIIRRVWLALSSQTTFLTGVVWKTKRTLSGKSPIRPIDTELRKVGRTALLRAYESNLKEVLKCVARLVKHLPGKTVITADHGELLGEKNEWGHRPYYHVPQLVEVPYFETST